MGFCSVLGGAAYFGFKRMSKETIAPEDPLNPTPLKDYAEGEWIPTGCAGCTSWCAKEVNVVEGRVLKIRGNPKSKVNGATSCPRSHMAIQQLYDPDRLKVPMKRTNPKKGQQEDPMFVPITWDEAANEIADRIMELRQNQETHKFMLLRGRYTQMNQNLYGRVPKILGSPNNISHSSICAEAEKFGPYYTWGLWAYRDYDVLKTKYIILWGADPISSNRQVSYQLSVWNKVMEQAEIAVVDPRFSASAAKADEWLPPKPGEDGALAVAMAHVILTEGLWSRDFVGDFKDSSRSFVVGEEVKEEDFEEIHTHGLVKWWNLELKDRTPAWAAERTGIPENQIIRVATRFAQNAPHVISWLGGGPCMQVRGGYTAMAVSALNGLVGSVDNEGGVLSGASVPHQGLPSEEAFIDDIAAAGNSNAKIDQRGYKEFPALNSGRSGGGVVTNRVADAILTEDPYDIKVAMGYWCNFAFSSPQTSRWAEALKKIPFFVHIVTHDSEMSRYADILLPSTHHMFEQWGYLTVKGNKHTHAWLARPVIERFFDVKDAETEVIWLVAEKLAEKGFSNLLDYFKTVKDPETGKEPTNGMEFMLYGNKHRLQPLWDPAEYKHGDRFDGWEDFVKAGVWNSAEYEYRKLWDAFKTETGKFEFYSETLKKALGGHAEKHNTSVDDILETCKYEVKGERSFVPHYEEPYFWGSPEEYPFVFVDHKSRLNREGRSANCYWYQDTKSVDPGDERWDDVARINPLDADKLGIRNGDEIKITSPVGEVTCRAKLWEGTVPGTVGKTYGQGHWAFGRVAATDFAKGTPRGGNNNDIIPADYERLSGSSSFYAHTRVRIERV